jgi:arginyl-tRNA synthetase
MQNTSYNLHKAARAWYNNLEPDSIEGLRDLYIKLAVRFSTSIPINKSSTELFGVTQQEDEFTRAYLKRFNEEMLKVEELLEQVALEALIRGVREHFF